jgi:exonuclease SbcC
MIPKKLTLKGIYSYQEKQEIDFTRLIDAGLFGIFGTVGSGKSTILEAISFALFGETERLNQKDNRGYNMMNLKSNELLIDFEFENSADDEEYKFVVRGKRNSKNFDKITTFERSAFKKISGEWESIATGSAEEIIGLSYQNFKRTIIIPQGKFQEFLELSETDRTRMLKEIFQLEKYDLYDRAARLDNENDEKKENLKGRIAELSDVDKQKVEVLSKKVLELENTKRKLEKDFVEIRKATEKLKETKKFFDEKKEKELELTDLKEQSEQISKEERILKNYEYCLINFKPKIDKLDDLESSQLEIQSSLNSKTSEVSELEKDLKTKLDTKKELDKFIKTIDARKQFFSDVEKTIEISKLTEEMKFFESQNDSSQTTLKEIVETRKELENSIVSDKKAFKEARTRLKSKETLLEALRIYTDIESFEEERSSFLKSIKELVQNNNSLFSIAGKGYRNVKDLTISQKSIEEKITAKTKIVNHLMVDTSLEEIANELRDGEKCRICGSTHHPDILNAKNSSKKLKEEEKSLENFKAELENITKTINEVETNLRIIEDKRSSILNLDQKIKILKKKLQSLQISLSRKEIELELDSVESIEQRADELDKKIEIQAEEIETLNSKFDSIKKEFDEKNSKLISITSKIETLSSQIISEKENLDIDNPLKFLSQQREELAEKEQLFQNISVEIEQKSALINSNKGIISELTKNLNVTSKKRAEISKDIEKEILASNYKNVELVQKLLAQNLDIEKVRQEINAFKTKVSQIQSRIIELDKKLGSLDFNDDNFEKNINILNQLEHSLNTIRSEYTRESTILERLEKDLKSKMEAEKALEALEARSENIKIIKKLFLKSGFVNYVSSIFLTNLINSANSRFQKLTRNSLSLEIDEFNSFHVRDFLNEGKLRSIKTLSGGQKFQASLSLALALAESIQEQNKAAQNFFFLDEGFGTLDKDNLNVVFEALKELRKENRIVGIISHVEDLQQEIDVYLRIENDEERGSIIKLS